MGHQRTLFIAIGAGLASALLFAASLHGAGLPLLLAGFTPLPIMIATLGFGHATGLIAAVVATFGLVLLLGAMPGLVFAVLFGFSSWFLPFLALLARPIGSPADGKPGLLLWYPVGRVVAWGAAVVIAGVLVLGGIVMLRAGGFEAAVSTAVAELETLVGAGSSEPFGGMTTARRVVQAMPILLSGLLFFVLMIDLWLAGRIVERSGLLGRPWPSLPENYRLPKATVAAFVVAALFVYVGGAPRVAAGVALAALGVAFVLQGLVAAHALTRGLAARPLILMVVYLVTVTLSPSLVALAVIGAVDCLVPFRSRQQTAPPRPKS